MNNETLRGSFKNCNFFVKRETIENIGLKQIPHDYPNSKIRYIESKGEYPFSATIEIFFGKKDDFDSFVSAMKEEQSGRLILPVYGIVNNIKAMPANADIDYTALGKYSMLVTFSESSEKPAPTTSETTTNDILNDAEAARQSVKKSVSRTYSVPTTVLSVMAIVSDAVVLSRVLFNVIHDRVLLAIFVRNFKKRIQNADLLANYLLSNADPVGFLEDISLKNNNFEMYKKIAIIGNTLPSEMYDIMDNQLMTYDTGLSSREINFTIPSWGKETLEREEKTKNRYLIINTFRIIGLIGMLESASKKDYLTVEEINKVMQDIEFYFENIIEKDTTNVLIPEMKIILNKLKGRTFEVLMQKKQMAYKIVTINLKDYMPATLLAYKLYGEYIKNETDLNSYTTILEGLNPHVPYHLMNGDVKVVEVG